MDLLTRCRKSDFLQNWNDLKSQLKPNVKQLLGGKYDTTGYKISGKCYFLITLSFQPAHPPGIGRAFGRLSVPTMGHLLTKGCPGWGI